MKRSDRKSVTCQKRLLLKPVLEHTQHATGRPDRNLSFQFIRDRDRDILPLVGGCANGCGKLLKSSMVGERRAQWTICELESRSVRIGVPGCDPVAEALRRHRKHGSELAPAEDP